MSRDVDIELISHTLAARILRIHTGRVGAAEVFYRAEDIDDETFDGSTALLSINFTEMMSITWAPYPMGDQGVSPEDTYPSLTEHLGRTALQILIERAAGVSEGQPPGGASSPTGAQDVAGGTTAPPKGASDSPSSTDTAPTTADDPRGDAPTTNRSKRTTSPRRKGT
jgi:hypothetical protein